MNNEEPGIKRQLYDLREHLGNELLKLEERVGLLNSYLRRTDYLEGTPDHRISEVAVSYTHLTLPTILLV